MSSSVRLLSIHTGQEICGPCKERADHCHSQAALARSAARHPGSRRSRQLLAEAVQLFDQAGDHWAEAANWHIDADHAPADPHHVIPPIRMGDRRLPLT